MSALPSASARTRTYLPLFLAAPSPNPSINDWTSWEKLLAGREHAPDANAGEAMTVVTDYGFGTLSSSLIALPTMHRDGVGPVNRFADGRPGEATYRAVAE